MKILQRLTSSVNKLPCNSIVNTQILELVCSSGLNNMILMMRALKDKYKMFFKQKKMIQMYYQNNIIVMHE